MKDCDFCGYEVKNITRHEKTAIHRARMALFPNHGKCFICSDIVDHTNERDGGCLDGEGSVFCFDLKRHLESKHHIERSKTEK